ncbi:MAG: ATP-binding cassette domain-containing protein, partial [Clostridiales bacterium]|nr:ATP-binding cassette domain-containing protein [Clostridiales bacterium]
SGGEQQRVAIARAVVKKPRLLLCDEPTGALDSKTGQRIVMLLQRFKVRYQTTIIVVTHNAKLAQVADRVIRLSDGKIVENSVNENPLRAGEIEW